MSLNNKQINFDINKRNIFNLTAKQFDTDGARSFTFRLLKDSMPFDLEGLTVKIGGKKPDGKDILNNCKVIDSKKGIVEVELTTQMQVVAGTLNLELIILKEATRLSTIQFVVQVIKSATDFKEVESSNEFRALQEALWKTDNVYDKNEINNFTWGMTNMGQDVKEAMTGGSVAIVGKESTGFINLNVGLRDNLNNLMSYNPYDYAQGSLSGEIGNKVTFVESVYRLRSIRPFKVIPNLPIKFKNLNKNFQIGFYELDKDLKIIKWNDYIDSDTTLLPSSKTYYLQVLIKNTTEGDNVINTSNLVDTIFLFEYDDISNFNELNKIIDEKTSFEFRDNQVSYSSFDYEQGSLNNGEVVINKARIHLKEYEAIKDKIYELLFLKSDYEVSFETYDENKKYIRWINYKDEDSIIKFNPNEKYYRLLIKKKVEEQFTPDDFCNEKNIIFKPSLSKFVEDINYELNNKITIASYNCGKWYNGISQGCPEEKVQEQTIKIRRMLAGLKADVLCIQEHIKNFDVDKTLNAEDQVLDYLFPYHYYSGTSTIHAELSIYSTFSLDNSDITWYGIDDRAFIKGYIYKGNKKICIINTHTSFGSNENRRQQIEKLIEEMKKETYVVVCGDFNVNSVDEFKLFEQSGFKISNCGYFGEFETWYNFGNNQSAPTPAIDNIITSSNIKIINVYTDNSDTSDHRALISELLI